MKHHTLIDSPYGPLTLVADDDGALCGLYMVDQRHRPRRRTSAAPTTPPSPNRRPNYRRTSQAS